jgi:hypothetical protein
MVAVSEPIENGFMEREIRQIREMITQHDKDGLLRKFKELVQGYRPQERFSQEDPDKIMQRHTRTSMNPGAQTVRSLLSAKKNGTMEYRQGTTTLLKNKKGEHECR